MNYRAIAWTFVGLAVAFFVGHDLGAGKPMNAWWWTAVVTMLVWPFIVHEEFSGNSNAEK